MGKHVKPTSWHKKFQKFADSLDAEKDKELSKPPERPSTYRNDAEREYWEKHDREETLAKEDAKIKWK
jgi:hypothetical protein